MKVKVITYRVEGEGGVGLFCDSSSWLGTDEASEILRNFNKVLLMDNEFCHLDYEDLRQHFCAFKNLNHTLQILPFNLLEYLEDCGLKLVEVRGQATLGETQSIFLPHEVKKKVITVEKLKSKLAKKIAKRDLRREFETLDISNYLILE